MNEEAPVALPPSPSVNLVAFGMACALSSAILLLYAADYLFLRIPLWRDVVKAVKSNVSASVQAVFDWGIAAWGVLLIFTVISVDQACRRAGQRRTIVINVAVLLCTVGLAFLVRHSIWSSLTSLFQGVGTSR